MKTVTKGLIGLFLMNKGKYGLYRYFRNYSIFDRVCEKVNFVVTIQQNCVECQDPDQYKN